MDWIDILAQAISERSAEVATLPQWVKNWVAFMRILFFSGIIFTPWWKAPRYVVLTMILSAAAIIAGKLIIPEFDTIMVGIISQLILWTPLLIYLVYNWRAESLPALISRKPFSTIYGIWIIAVIVTICVSQVFNLIGFAKFVMGLVG